MDTDEQTDHSNTRTKTEAKLPRIAGQPLLKYRESLHQPKGDVDLYPDDIGATVAGTLRAQTDTILDTGTVQGYMFFIIICLMCVRVRVRVRVNAGIVWMYAVRVGIMAIEFIVGHIVSSSCTSRIENSPSKNRTARTSLPSSAPPLQILHSADDCVASALASPPAGVYMARQQRCHT
jgi:hypothetical protein